MFLGKFYCPKDFFTELYDSFEETSEITNDPSNVARIKKVFSWLEDKKFYDVLNELLIRMPEEKYIKLLDIMGNAFFMLKVIPVNILRSIKFPEEEIQKILKLRKQEYCEIFALENYDFEKQNTKGLRGSEMLFFDKLPGWFKEELYAGRHERTIYSILANELELETSQNSDLPSVRSVTHPIIGLIQSLIYKVLERKPVTYYGSKIVTKEKVPRLKFKKIKCRQIITPRNLPFFHDLRYVPLEERKLIMNKALGVTPEMGLDFFSKQWQFYLGIILYWLKEDVEPERNEFHAYAAVFLALKHVIDVKLKEEVETWRQSTYRYSFESIVAKNDSNLDIAIAEVSKNDCLTIKKYFKEKSGRKSLPNEFQNVNLKTVHIYNMFQYCLKDLISLNKILGDVYENPSLKNLLCGTFFYNLYEDFRGRADIDVYVEEKLQNAPSLLRVCKILMDQLMKMCGELNLQLFSKSFAPVVNVSQSVTLNVPRNMFFPFKK